MSKYKYKNISENDLVVMGVGEVKAGEVIETDHEVENPNLELVKDEKVKSK